MFEETEKDIKLKKEIGIILDYYKLIYIEKLTKDKSLDTFKMLGGDYLCDYIISGSKEYGFSLDAKNFFILSELENKMNKLINSNISINASERDKIRSLKWFNEIIAEIDPSEVVADTIVNNASVEVYNKYLKHNIRESYDLYMEKEEISKVKSLIELTKNI